MFLFTRNSKTLRADHGAKKRVNEQGRAVHNRKQFSLHYQTGQRYVWQELCPFTWNIQSEEWRVKRKRWSWWEMLFIMSVILTPGHKTILFRAGKIIFPRTPLYSFSLSLSPFTSHLSWTSLTITDLWIHGTSKFEMSYCDNSSFAPWTLRAHELAKKRNSLEENVYTCEGKMWRGMMEGSSLGYSFLEAEEYRRRPGTCFEIMLF